jgi:Tol biopolymer transport system component
MRHGALRNGLATLALIGLLATPATSEAKFWNFFYENYPDVDWLTLETEHFRIHYYPEIEWTARMMAKYAEISYPKVTGMFDYPLKEKVHIVLRDMEENANGFAVYGSDWVTVWSTPLYYVLRGRQEWIPDVFAHEFTHIVSLKVNDWKSESALVLFASGLIEDGVHNIDFGARAMIGFATPYWWTEGVAEYGTHLAGFNWWTTSRDMHLRAAVLEDNALTFEEMFTPGNKDTSFDREKGYQQGYSMALYVMEKYGKEQFAQMAVNQDREGHLVWEKNIEDVLGVEGHQLYDGYMNWMRDRYKRQIDPVLKEQHVGSELMITSAGEEVDVLEKLPDGRVKVQIGKAKFKPGFPFDDDEAEALIEKRKGDVEKLEDAALKAEGEVYLTLLADQRKAYQAAERELEARLDAQNASEAEELRQELALAKRFFAGKQTPDNAELAAAFEKADQKRDKPKIEYWDKRQRKAYYEKGGGSWDMIPRTSPDGKWTALAGRRGVTLLPIAAEDFPLFSGHYLSGTWNAEVAENSRQVPAATVFNGYQFSPDSKKVLYSSLGCPDTWMPCVNFDNYYRYDLFTFDIESEEVERLSKRLRAVYAAYSPDGQNIAFVHIEDGQNWLGVFPAAAREVEPDGKCVIDGQPREKCIRWLVQKHDGTQVGQPSWSPDGAKLVFDLYRNHQQDVWMINADGTDLHPLTWDRAEDRDSTYTPDGKSILYSSDRTGIFNVYQMDLETREVRQLTNLVNGAYTPQLTANGDMLYSYFTSHGLKIHGLKKSDFYNKVIDAGYEISPEEVARNLAYQEPLPEIREKSGSYNAFNPRNWPPIDGVPLFIYERRGINVGGFVSAQDILGKHAAFGQLLLGETSDYRFFYINNMWYPQFILGWVHVDFAGDFAQGFGSSELVGSRAEPHFEQPLSYKYRQSVDFGIAGISYDIGPYLEINAQYLYRYYTSVSRTDTQNDAFLTNNSYSLGIEYNGISPYGTEADINPRGGRKMSFEYMFTRSGLPEKEYADVEWLGRRNPPGDHSDDYTYHEMSLGYTEAIPISWWNPQGQHTLEFHLRGGWQNRNVQRFDEFFAGSLHPLRYVPTQSTTNEFAGYEDFSLGGETMLVVGLAYRFPIYRHIDRKFGPFYFASVWGEVFGTAGNLWGYTGEYVRDVYGNIARHPESYYDPYVKRGTVRREIPFVDIASKNGNYMLYDVGFALKLKAYMFGYLPWNSFVRVAYGLNDVIGQNEVNDDRVYVDVFPNDASMAESEPKSLRISIGIGSDFD